MSEPEKPVNKNKKYRKDKPDDPTIDKWKIDPITPGEMKAPLLETSSFAVMFPKYRENYLKEVFPIVKNKMREHHIKADLDLIEGTMTVRTTNKTWDPYIILKARDVIKLLSRSVPYMHALNLMNDGVDCDVIKIRSFVRNKERFIKRRQRLVGPKGMTLKALELLTNCYILVQGGTISCIGYFKNLKVLRRIVEDCMKNIHPIYHIKELMIKKELAKNPEMAEENWERFLPQFKKRNVKRKKMQINEKKEYKVFPDEPEPRKIDKLIESGEIFKGEETKTAKARREKVKQMLKDIEQVEEKEEVKAEKANDKKKREKKERMMPPEEEVTLLGKKRHE